MTRTKSFKSVLALGGCLLAMLAVAPASFAGEDDGGDSAPVRVHRSSGGGGGGSDSGSASGGVQAGFGGMSATDHASLMIPLGLAGGGVLVLSAAGALSRRRVPQL